MSGVKEKTFAGKFGWIPDLPDKRDHYFEPPRAAVRLAKLEPVADKLRKRMLPAFDQGPIGSCTGNMGAGAVLCQQALQNRPLIAPSRLALYYDARSLIGTTNQDSGAYIRDIFKVLKAKGVGAETLWPYNVSKFKVRPTQSYYDKADDQQALKYERVQQRLMDMKTSLAVGVPICLGFTVYESFMSSGTAFDGLAQMPLSSDRSIGGHAVLVVGYTNNLQAVHSLGSKLKIPSWAKKIIEWFIVRNSWGSKWGDKGDFYIPVDYFLDPDLCADLWRLLLLE